MALPRDFKETIQARVARGPALREALFKERVECTLAGEVETGKTKLRDYINAKTGFEAIGHLERFASAHMTMILARWRSAFVLCALGVLFVGGAPDVLGDDDYSRKRARMIEVIETHLRRTPLERHDEAFDQRVLDAMARTPRHLFVPEAERDDAYADRPLPIGYGQTISQPFIVAFMTHMLKPAPDHVVLEVGTGSGYQAAILAPLVRRVCTIEIIPELGESARQRLEEQGYDNVHTRIGDGYYGWEECGPFDGIVVTAAADHLPPPLIEQLKPDGRMIMPVGRPFVMQHLVLATKGDDERLYTRALMPVAFVPLRHEAK